MMDESNIRRSVAIASLVGPTEGCCFVAAPVSGSTPSRSASVRRACTDLIIEDLPARLLPPGHTVRQNDRSRESAARLNRFRHWNFYGHLEPRWRAHPRASYVSSE